GYTNSFMASCGAPPSTLIIMNLLATSVFTHYNKVSSIKDLDVTPPKVNSSNIEYIDDAFSGKNKPILGDKYDVDPAVKLGTNEIDIKTNKDQMGEDIKDGLQVNKGASGSKSNILPKTRLPRTNGKWTGEPGNGKWFSNNPEVNKITGGKGVEFKNGRPDFSPWKKGKLKFKEGVLDGSSNDFNAIYDKIKQAKGFKSRNQAKDWLREKGLTPHHKSSTEIDLIPKNLHKKIPHIGSASELRGGGK
ncbi:hypothetical protein, partial [Clostridium sp.]|uniref:hypothetical protein n=1 Tax=Clostridium sp. TaxID=1506 RepID=UPI003217D540